MESNSLAIALEEFIHVGGALVVIVAVVSVLTGLMREYIPQDRLQKQLNKHERFGSFIGASFGTLTPFCSASVVPVSMGMAEMGVSLGTILGFLISAPLCNFVVVGMILAMFGLKVTLVYFGLTFSSAVVSGFLIARSPWRNEVKRGAELAQAKKSVPTCGGPSPRGPVAAVEASGCGCGPRSAARAIRDTCSEGAAGRSMPLRPNASGCGSALAAVEPVLNARVAVCGSTPAIINDSVGGCGVSAPSASGLSHGEKFRNALRFACVLFKRIVPYVLAGAVISGLSAAYLPAELVAKYVGGASWYGIPIAAGIGVPLYLRIEMALPLLTVLIAKGMGMGAAMALLIGGTGASLPEIALISSVLKPKGVVAFVFIVLTTAILGGVLYQYVL